MQKQFGLPPITGDVFNFSDFYNSKNGQNIVREICKHIKIYHQKTYHQLIKQNLSKNPQTEKLNIGVGYALPFISHLPINKKYYLNLMFDHFGGETNTKIGLNKSVLINYADLPISDNIANFIFIMHAAEYCPDLQIFSDEIARITASQGKILLVMPALIMKSTIKPTTKNSLKKNFKEEKPKIQNSKKLIREIIREFEKTSLIMYQKSQISLGNKTLNSKLLNMFNNKNKLIILEFHKNQLSGTLLREAHPIIGNRILEGRAV